MNDWRDGLAIAMFGRERHGNACVTCGGPIEGFRDLLSEREYKISGMCQECQDSVFEPEGLDNEE